ncbi:MAG: hypothetical protein JO211_10090, partial [Acidobacteriaceae bacterium]|nr:hypothetical protein [Acidobacteriaceae bacterium]
DNPLARDLVRGDRQQTGLRSTGEQDSDRRSDSLQQADGAKTEATEGRSQGNASNSQRENRGVQHGAAQDRDGNSAAQQAAGDKAAQNAENRENSAEDRQNGAESKDGQQGSSGLIAKMKDALSSLMEKMRPNQAGQKSAQNGQPTPQDQKNGNSAAAKNGQAQQDARNQQASENQSSEAQGQGQTTEKVQGSQGRNSDQSAEKDSDAHSGIGRQNGDKDVKEAEQLRAMGKLAEIIGKRSASVTGEMMVETASGKQQLKTAYSQRLGRHSDVGGEINRDEIPLADQRYIREYMELVRKQAKTQPTERPE